MKSLTTPTAFGLALMFAALATAQTRSKTATPLATGIARNQQELKELSTAVSQNNADMRKIAADVVVSLTGAIAGAGPESAFGQSPREALSALISSYQRIQGALETKDSLADGNMWMALSGQLKLTLDLIGETELPIRFANTLTDLVVKTTQLAALAHTNADLAAAAAKVARAQQYLLARSKELAGTAAAPYDEAALRDIEDYLANFPIHLDPIPLGPDANGNGNNAANGAELDKALNENMTRMMGADNPYLPDLRIQAAPDEWTQWQAAFQGMAQIGNAFNPPHRSPITPELLASMDNWLKQLKQAQSLMFQALAAAGNSPACKVVNPTNGGDGQGGIFDNDNPVMFFHYANAAACNRLYAVFRGYNNAFMSSTPPPVTAGGTKAATASSAPAAQPKSTASGTPAAKAAAAPAASSIVAGAKSATTGAVRDSQSGSAGPGSQTVTPTISLKSAVAN